MPAPTEPTTPELIAARWRKEVAKHLIDIAGMIATGRGLVGAPDETEIDDAYGLILALVAPDGIIVSSHGVRLKEDVSRVRTAISDAFDPDDARRRREYWAGEQAKVDAYNARPFACEIGCSDRFDTERGRATHYAAARRRGDRDYRHSDPGIALTARPAPRPRIVETVE